MGKKSFLTILGMERLPLGRVPFLFDFPVSAIKDKIHRSWTPSCQRSEMRCSWRQDLEYVLVPVWVAEQAGSGIVIRLEIDSFLRSAGDQETIPDLEIRFISFWRNKGHTEMARPSNEEDVLLVDAAVEPFNKICCLDFKCRADSQEGPYGDRPAGFDLLPVACGKSVADHVFLCITMSLTQLLDPHA
jgi:hypothetical protein